MNRALIVVGAACAAALVWAVFAVHELGYTWPYPRVLPGTISHHGATYFKQPVCHSRGWWSGPGGAGGARTAGPVGRLASAIGIGGLTEYGRHRRAFNGYLFVGVGGCYVEYQANASGH